MLEPTLRERNARTGVASWGVLMNLKIIISASTLGFYTVQVHTMLLIGNIDADKNKCVKRTFY